MTWWMRLLRRDRLDRQLDAELRDHVERQVADYVAGGMPEAEARRRARLEFGGLDRVKEECRDARGTRWLEDAGQDLRYALRLLGASPAFTAVAVLSLALGIGANTAIFSLVNSLLLRSLPVAHAERLVLLDGGSWTNPIWEQIRDRQDDLFDGATAWGSERFNLSASGQTDFVEGFWASGRFFEVLGVPAMIGRTFGPGDDRRGGGPDGPVAVISYGFWQRRFGGAADVVGRALALDGVPFTVVGVTPPSFFGPDIGRSFDVIVPIGAEPALHGDESILDERSTWWLNVTARLKPGQTVEEATAALRAIQPQVRDAARPAHLPAGEPFLAEPFTLLPASGGLAEMRRHYRDPLLILMGVVAFVLLIACANVANLMLARAHARRHELGMRLALGASRARIARQLLTESLLVAAGGAVLGLAVARWSSSLLLRQLSTPQRAVFLDLSLDWRMLAFTVAVAVATALFFGVAPVFRLNRLQPTEAVREQVRQVGEGRQTLSGPAVVLQVALSLVLVVAAGLFVRSFATLADRDLGFDADALLIVAIDAQKVAGDRGPVLLRAGEAAAAVADVASASVSMLTPVSGSGWNNLVVLPDGLELPRQQRLVWINAIAPDWFATYGLRVVAGRDFEPSDRRGSRHVAIVNEAYVNRFLQGTPPIGATVQTSGRPDRPPPIREIVGVVSDSAYRSVREPFPPTVYLPLAQLPADDVFPFAAVTVRPRAGDPARLARSVVDAIAQVDAGLALTPRTMTEQVNGTLVQERLLAMLSGFFGALALLLAGVGLYGVTAYAVGRRRTEIGIRMALGADGARVTALMLGKAMLFVGAGLAAGVILSLALSRYVTSLLFELRPTDPLTLSAAVGLLAMVGAFAAWLPARRAARIDPAQVLREG